MYIFIYLKEDIWIENLFELYLIPRNKQHHILCGKMYKILHLFMKGTLKKINFNIITNYCYYKLMAV